MGFFGSLLGSGIGGLFSKKGKSIGGTVGSYLPFKEGGSVNRTQKAQLHQGEYVLPKGVPATKAQKRAVAAIKADKKGRKKRK